MKWIARLWAVIKPAIDKIVSLWKALVSFTRRPVFIAMFPFIIFGFGGIFYGSVIMVLAFIVWLIPMLDVLNEKQD